MFGIMKTISTEILSKIGVNFLMTLYTLVLYTRIYTIYGSVYTSIYSYIQICMINMSVWGSWEPGGREVEDGALACLHATGILWQSGVLSDRQRARLKL